MAVAIIAHAALVCLRERSGRIRALEIPTSLIAKFTAIAEPNTRQEPYGIETCGILAGELVRLIVHCAAKWVNSRCCHSLWSSAARLEPCDHDARDPEAAGSSCVVKREVVLAALIVCAVQGSSDMCYMTNEEELFDYCFGHDLLTLGWIHVRAVITVALVRHRQRCSVRTVVYRADLSLRPCQTHPRQTCFLSSVDIHTQCGFQSILPEVRGGHRRRMGCESSFSWLFSSSPGDRDCRGSDGPPAQVRCLPLIRCRHKQFSRTFADECHGEWR